MESMTDKRSEMNKEIREGLNSIKFSGIDIENIGDALSTVDLFYSSGEISLFGAIKDMMSFVFMDGFTFETKRDEKILACFTPSYFERTDFKEDMHRAMSTMDSYAACFPRHKFIFKPSRIGKSFRVFSWLHSMKCLKADFAYKLFCCAFILRGYNYRNELLEYLKKNNINPNLVVTFCDVHVCDYFVTEYFNKKGIPTATLQHAGFDHVNTDYANIFSQSKYFLGITKFAKKEFVLSGEDGDRFHVLGSLKYIDKQPNEDIVYHNTKTFGIALSGIAFENQNETLIEIGKKLSNELGYNAIVRCHPALNREKYSSLIDSSCMTLDGKESLSDFSDKCDFCIMGSTNTFGELIANGHLAYRMIIGSDVFEGIECFNFSDYDGLKQQIKMLHDDFDKVKEDYKATREWVCAPGNIRENYTQFFKQFTD